MKTFKRFIAYFSIITFALILVLILIAELAENKVTKIALNRLNQQVDANLAVKNIDFSLIKDFPDAIVELQDVGITVDNDTLAQINRLFISVEVKPLLKSEFIIKEISVEGGMANYQIDSSGRTNFDVFLVESEDAPADTSSGTLYLSLKHLELKDLFCSFNDDQNQISACLYIDEGLTSIYIDNENTKATFNGQLRANQCRYPESPLHLMNELRLGLDVVYFNDLVTVNNLHIDTDGIDAHLKGEVRNDSSIYTNLQVNADNLDLGILKKYIPDSLSKAYELKQLAGVLKADAAIKGIYNDSIMPRINATLNLSRGTVLMSDYPLVTDIRLAGQYDNGELMNNQATQIQIDTFTFVSGGSKGLLSAKVSNLEEISYQIQSDLLVNLNDVSAYMPDSLIKHIDGEIEVQFQTNGVLPEKYDLAFADYILARSSAGIRLRDMSLEMDSLIELRAINAEVAFKNQQFELTSLNGEVDTYGLSIEDGQLNGRFEGSLTDVNSLNIVLEEIELATPKSHLKGDMAVKNLDAPFYTIDADAIANLSEFKVFAPDSLIKDMSGVLSVHIQSEGKIDMDDMVESIMERIFTDSELEAQMQDITVLMHDPLMQVKDVTGQLSLKNDLIGIKKLSGSFADITFNSDSSFVQNFYTGYWLNQPDTIKAEGYFQFGDIDYSLFESFMADDATNTETAAANIEEPVNYCFQAKGKIAAKSFWYGNALFENLSALYNVSDSLYIADQVKFDAFKGSTNSSVKVQMLPGEVMKVNFKNSTKGLDVNQLLYDFDDFMDYTNEVYISHEQLSGIFSTDSLDGQVVFIGDSLDQEKLKLKANLKLENGRLKDYPITEEMANDYNRPELKDIIFETLDTKLFSYRGDLYIPQTEVKTNAYDISILGKQEFDLDCQYHLRFYLKEILRGGKTNRIEKKQESGKIKQGGGAKGLASMFAIYKVEDGKTEKSGLEGRDSEDKKKLRSQIYLKEAMAKLEFHPLIVKYNTGVIED